MLEVVSWQFAKMKDILGKEVATLIDVYKPSGIYKLSLMQMDYQAEFISIS